MLAFFERFQQTVERSWKRELARWMAANGGFLQYGARPPAIDLLPDRAIEWLLNCHNLTELEWVFIGRGHGRDADEAGGVRRGATGTSEVFIRGQLRAWLDYMTKQ